jgi:hypothetical protein
MRWASLWFKHANVMHAQVHALVPPPRGLHHSQV